MIFQEVVHSIKTGEAGCDEQSVTLEIDGDNGADPNKLVKVTDRISATQPATNGYLDRFETIRSARAGEAFRGVALAPEDGR